jgi:hypothetical protein
MNSFNSRSNQWLTLIECLFIAFLPLIGLGIGCAALPQGRTIVQSFWEGYAQSLMVLSTAFYVFPAFFAEIAFEALRGHGLTLSPPSTTHMVVCSCIQSLALGFILWFAVGRRQLATKLLRPFGFMLAVFLAGHALVGWFVYSGHRTGRETYTRLMTADHPALLSACRFMLSNRSLYTNDWPTAFGLEEGEINISQEQIQTNTNVPPIIREMNTRSLDLREKYVIATLPGPPRLYFIGYAQGAAQKGTIRLIDGLWFFNGNGDWPETNDKSGQQE